MMNLELEWAIADGAPIEVLMELAGVTEEEIFGDIEEEEA